MTRGDLRERGKVCRVDDELVEYGDSQSREGKVGDVQLHG